MTNSQEACIGFGAAVAGASPVMLIVLAAFSITLIAMLSDFFKGGRMDTNIKRVKTRKTFSKIATKCKLMFYQFVGSFLAVLVAIAASMTANVAGQTA